MPEPKTTTKKVPTKPKEKSVLELRVDALEIKLGELEGKYGKLIADYKSRFSGALVG